jgi:hypothetical protein
MLTRLHHRANIFSISINFIKYIIISYVMSESQSRYSIIERLTQSKLEIISSKSKLDGEITEKKQSAEEAKADLKDWKNNIKAEQDRHEREMQRKIEKLERDAKNAEARKKIKEQTYDLKLKAIEDALTKLEKVSEAASRQENS